MRWAKRKRPVLVKIALRWDMEDLCFVKWVLS